MKMRRLHSVIAQPIKRQPWCAETRLMLIGDKQAQIGGKMSSHTQDQIGGNTHGMTGENTHGMTGDKTIWRVLSCSLLFAEQFLNNKHTGFSF